MNMKRLMEQYSGTITGISKVRKPQPILLLGFTDTETRIGKINEYIKNCKPLHIIALDLTDITPYNKYKTDLTFKR